eukprot:SAG25_NODE_115_length_14839_cov_35.722524_2_plen_483_part_00
MMSEGVPPMNAKSAVPVAAPKTLRYEQDAGLPVAIEARSNRRSFYPSNGQTFSPGGTNVIRMTLNSNSFLDFSHSYLQFEFTNADQRCQPDLGVPFFSRLQIMSGGQELEDIQEWSRLYSILLSAQGSRLNSDELSLTQHDPNVFAATGPGFLAADLTDASVVANLAATNVKVQSAVNSLNPSMNPVVSATDGLAADTGKQIYNVPLMSAIFNIEKYFPLLLTDQGLDIYLTLNPTKEIGCYAGQPTTDYTLSNVQYVAHEVHLDDGFVNQMKASMAATGGMLSLSSTTYRYYQLTGTAASEDLNISCRVKSLKGMLVRPQALGVTNNHAQYSVSTGQALGITELQFRIGSVLYPQSAIKFSPTNKGELFQEIRKCFGTIGSYNHGTMLNHATFANNTDEAAATVGASGSQRSLWFAAYDFETFAKSATESGINISDRALPVTLSLTKGGLADQKRAGRYDTFAMCDCIIYIDLMGRITTRI